MQIKLKFLGAAQNVTGSRHLLEANGRHILVDCGLYQERQLRARNWDPFPALADSIDAVLLTHAHLDHCGLLPKLVREGFTGRIYSTAATSEIAKIILLDSAKLQEEDAEHKRKRHERQGRKGPYPVVPLYTTEDAEACFPLFSTVEYRKSVNIGDGVEATFYDAGHVLGSSIIRVKVRQDAQERIILFSGDIGRPDRPIVCDPTVFDYADYVLIESTYGDGSQSRSFCFVDDLVEAMIRMMKAPDDVTGPINIGNPNEFSILELAEKVIAQTGSQSKIIYQPLPEDDPLQRKPDIKLAREHLGWEPRTQLEEGLKRTIDYFKGVI